MSHRLRGFGTWLALVAVVGAGCQPTQPFFFMEDGDLSHYLDVAAEIEYPDVDEPSLAEVDGAVAPLTIDNFDQFDLWDLTLEEASRITLKNSQVMRQLGGRIVSNAADTISRSLVQSGVVTTTYDPALVESGYGANTGVAQSGTGVEAALAEYDANLVSSVFWEKNSRPQNTTFFTPGLIQDTGQFTAEINKFTADGTTFAVRNNTLYDSNNNFFRGITSEWNTNFEAEFAHPLLQGRGTQYNRIAGPFSFDQFNSGFANQFDGVVISRIRHDLSLADFEGGVRNLMRDVETAYWELYFAYRNLEAQKAGQKSALATWKTINELRKVGDRRGAAHEEARARAQFFFFRSQVETTVTDLLRAENRLRYIMGLATSDGRLVRPVDEPTMAELEFDWSTAHCEALARRVEIRKQKWNVKRRDLELIAARNHLLPRLDAVGRYRWLGVGDDLIDSSGTGAPAATRGSNAFEILNSGDYQEWQFGLRFSMPIGLRRGHTTVRHHQQLIARERAILQDLELEVSHQLGDAIRDVALNHRLSQTHFNRHAASLEEVRSYAALFEAGSNDPVTGQPVTADIVLEAQRRQFDAAVAYFRALIDYNLSILRVHERKGSLLDYNGVYLAEGPWPAKAYFDALRRARKRDAATYLDYGYTRPGVVSRGPIQQGVSTAGPAGPTGGDIIYEGPIVPYSGDSEAIPVPQPESPNSGDGVEIVPEPIDSAAAPTAARPAIASFSQKLEPNALASGASTDNVNTMATEASGYGSGQYPMDGSGAVGVSHEAPIVIADFPALPPNPFSTTLRAHRKPETVSRPNPPSQASFQWAKRSRIDGGPRLQLSEQNGLR